MVEDYGGHGGGMMIQFGSAMAVLWGWITQAGKDYASSGARMAWP